MILDIQDNTLLKMIVQTPAYIFKAAQRTAHKGQGYLGLTTLGGVSKNRNAQRFGLIKSMSDEYLAAQGTKTFNHGTPGVILVVPLVGAIEIAASNQHDRQGGGPGEIIRVASQGELVISNPDQKNPANFLLVCLEEKGASGKLSLGEFGGNQLFSPIKLTKHQMCFGFFDGRQGAAYPLEDLKNGILAYVINGTFELENRLLESRDALAVWNLETVEMEALSENAIILLFETPLPQQ